MRRVAPIVALTVGCLVVRTTPGHGRMLTGSLLNQGVLPCSIVMRLR